MSVKKFEIDWNSLEEVRSIFNASKTRYFELKRAQDNIPTRKERNLAIFESANAIYSTDISAIYKGRVFDEETKYYVYAHLDTRRKIAVGFSGLSSFAATLGMEYMPFYIGKGVGNRLINEKRSETYGKIVNAIKSLGKEIQIVKIKSNLTESQAFQLESKLIDIFGLVPQKGCLSNLDEGLNSKDRRSLYKEHLNKVRLINEVLYLN